MLTAMLKEKVLSGISEGSNAIYYIIGNNGTGKSRLLNEVAQKLSKEEATSRVLCIANTLYDKFSARHDKIIYLGLRTAVSNAIFFSAIERTLSHFLLQCLNNGTYEKLEQNLSMAFSLSFSKSVKKHTIESYYDNRKTKSKNIATFLKPEQQQEILSLAGNDFNFSFLTSKQRDALSDFLTLNPNNLKLRIINQNGIFNFGELSSGEQNKILLSAKILANISNNCTILIDEPEISLHLHWQIQFHRFINDLIANYTGVSVIIASHSPVIVSEAYKYENSSAIIILDNINPGKRRHDKPDNAYNYIHISRGDSERFENIVFDFFDTATYRSIAIDEEIASILTKHDRYDGASGTVIEQLESLKKKIEGIADKEKIIEEAITLLEAMGNTPSPEDKK